jgi:hypothetical protein
MGKVAAWAGNRIIEVVIGVTVAVIAGIIIYKLGYPRSGQASAQTQPSPSGSCANTVRAGGAALTHPGDGADVPQYVNVTGLVSCAYVAEPSQVLKVVIGYNQTWYPEGEATSASIDADGHWSLDHLKIGNPQDHGLTYTIAVFRVSQQGADSIKQMRSDLQASGQWDDQGIPRDDLGQLVTSEDVRRS